jgi:hypothetical protein
MCSSSQSRLLSRVNLIPVSENSAIDWAGVTVPSLGLRVGGANFHALGCAPAAAPRRAAGFQESNVLCCFLPAPQAVEAGSRM